MPIRPKPSTLQDTPTFENLRMNTVEVEKNINIPKRI